jgi:ADP-heptose:LPS heptosyltransferase
MEVAIAQIMNMTKNFFQFLKQNSKLKILIIRDGLIGDIVFITPLINRLRNQFSDATIDVVVSSNSVDVLRNFPGIRNIIPLKSKASLLYHVKFFFKLRKNKYDIVLVQEVNSHYTLMSILTGAKFRIGFKNKADKYLDLVNERKGHAVLAELGSVYEWTKKVNGDKTVLFTSQNEEARVQLLLTENYITKSDLVVCLQVGCSEPNSPRQWVNDYFAELADRLVEKINAKIIFTGTLKESEEISTVQSLMKNSSVSFAGKTNVRELIALIKEISIIIGPDTGTLHIATALNIPALMLTGYADPNDTGVYDPGGYSRNLFASLDCVPCKFKNPKPVQWEICKNIRPTLCMEKLSVDKVEETVLDILKKKYNISVVEN